MLLRLLRMTPRLETGPCNSNTASLASQLPHDVLLAIFASLRPSRGPRDDALTHPDGFFAVRRHNLVCAARVCRAWFVAATALLYRSVRLATATKCITFARTLASRPRLAALVRDVAFSEETAVLSLPLGYTRSGLQRLLSPAQRRLRAAVITVVNRCTSATHFYLTFPASEAIFDTFQLDVLAPRLQKLSLCQCDSHYRKLGSEPPNNHWYTSSSSLSALSPPRFANLEVLSLSNMNYYFHSVPPQPTIRTSFPVLRALFLSRIQIPNADLCGMLRELGPSLNTLSFYDVIVQRGLGFPKSEFSGPLALLDEHIIPSGCLSALKELSIRVLYLCSPIPPGRREELRLNNFCTGTPTLTTLTISAAVLEEMHAIPASLEHLIVYHEGVDDSWTAFSLRKRTEAFIVAANLKLRLPQLTLCAPRLRIIQMRAFNVCLHHLFIWKIVSFLLHSFCQDFGVIYTTEMRLSHMDVRLAMRRAEQAKRGLRITQLDERRVVKEFLLSQDATRWDLSGYY
ncbi:hypothetical protein EXIGLDRAFT_840113 [Exidia glandulosa HHB12029]|uniref:F-box domain-containing protein n=1 Tax=Exidia glandulosa HHB12029 TaxID=1314781 RepID=A0A165ELY0_EXIGL|nr:hypothetical protein EXIGLDRAFT_840113 [Exidia glandulosa HHB12029]